jgi:hypothetical protein
MNEDRLGRIYSTNEKNENAHVNLIVQPSWKRQYERPRHIWEDTIKMNLRQGVKGGGFCEKIMHFWLPSKHEIFCWS